MNGLWDITLMSVLEKAGGVHCLPPSRKFPKPIHENCPSIGKGEYLRSAGIVTLPVLSNTHAALCASIGNATWKMRKP